MILIKIPYYENITDKALEKELISQFKDNMIRIKPHIYLSDIHLSVLQEKTTLKLQEITLKDLL